MFNLGFFKGHSFCSFVAWIVSDAIAFSFFLVSCNIDCYVLIRVCDLSLQMCHFVLEF